MFGPDGKPLCEPVVAWVEVIVTADVNLRGIDYPMALSVMVRSHKFSGKPKCG